MIYLIVTLWIIAAIARAAQHTFLSPYSHWDRSKLKRWKWTRVFFEKNLWGIKILDGSHTCAFIVETFPVITFTLWCYYWVWILLWLFLAGELLWLLCLLLAYYPAWYLIYFWVFNLFFHRFFVHGGDGKNIFVSLIIYFPLVDIPRMALSQK